MRTIRREPEVVSSTFLALIVGVFAGLVGGIWLMWMIWGLGWIVNWMTCGPT